MTEITPGTAMRLARRVGALGSDADVAPASARIVVVPDRVVDALRDALLGGETHYTSRPGMPALRARVAEALRWLGAPAYDPTNGVVITAGVRESLFVVLLGLRPRSGGVLVAGGAAREYEGLFRLMQLTPVPAPAPEDCALGLIYRERHLDAGLLAVVLQLGEERALVDVLNVREAIGTFEAGSLPPISPDRTVIIGSLDALEGVRAFGVGFVAGPAAVMARVRTWKQAFSICTAAPSQRTALVAIDAWWREAG